MQHSLKLLVSAVVLVLAGCSKLAPDNPEKRKATQSPVVTNIEQRGDDTYADLQLRQEWIAEGRTVVVEIPLGETIQLTLSPVMTEGKQLRFKGKGSHGTGDLLLRVCITE